MRVYQEAGNVEGDKNLLFKNISNSNINMSRTMIFPLLSSQKTVYVDRIKDVNIKFNILERDEKLYFILQMMLMLLCVLIWVVDVPFSTFFSSTFFNIIAYFSLLSIVLLISTLPLYLIEYFGFGVKKYKIEFKNGKFGGKPMINNFVTKQAQYIKISSAVNDENFIFEFKDRLEASKFFSLFNR